MHDPHAIIVVDLAFGDCGKGTIVDFLTRQCAAHTVVRFNGGPQAGHNIVTPDGRHHTFAQIGAGAFVPGVRTLLSRFMLIEPYALLNEAEHLRQLGVADALDRLMIDERCSVITPAHQAANRLVEIARGDNAHGTCGMGIGQTMQDLIDHRQMMLSAGEFRHRASVIRKLRAIRDLKMDQLRDCISAVRLHPKAQKDIETLIDPSWISAAADHYREVSERAQIVNPSAVGQSLRAPGTLVFEGAQGVLLDEWFGFHPHTTWSTTTFANANTLLDEAAYAGRRTRVGVLRSYFTRHGAGPLVTENPALLPHLPEPHNDPKGWQGLFRVGVFDAVAAQYALAVAGPVDMLAVTHLDRLSALPPHICTAYQLDRPLDAKQGQVLSDAFDVQDNCITAIRPAQPATLSIAEMRTGILRHCRPIYTTAPVQSAEAFLDHLNLELKAPVGIGSFGPGAGDKCVLDSGVFDAASRLDQGFPTADRSATKFI